MVQRMAASGIERAAEVQKNSTRPHTAAAFTMLNSTAALAVSLARLASGWCSSEVWSTAASSAELSSSTTSTSRMLATISTLPMLLAGESSATGMAIAAISTSWRNASSYRHAARNPANEVRAACQTCFRPRGCLRLVSMLGRVCTQFPPVSASQILLQRSCSQQRKPVRSLTVYALRQYAAESPRTFLLSYKKIKNPPRAGGQLEQAHVFDIRPAPMAGRERVIGPAECRGRKQRGLIAIPGEGAGLAHQ